MKRIYEDAVSPVVGVMLMIVVVIIIAAIVSAFAGSAMTESKKTPQANIKATFSTTGGMQIIHAGGDTIPTQDLVFELTLDPTFGSGLDAITTTVINRTIITDVNRSSLFNPVTGITLVDPSFKPGDTLFVNIHDSDCQYLQTAVAPCNSAAVGGHGFQGSPACGWTGTNSWYIVYWDGTKYVYPETKAFWNLCFVNQNNIGKTFTLTVLDKRTTGVISKSTVTITA
jgi:FlaG/FlaF family flagellin (archaellin)